MDKIQTAYLAGIIDGEGTIGLIYKRYKRRVNYRYFMPELAVSNTDKELLYYIRDIIGFGSVSRSNYRRGNMKDIWRFYTHSIKGVGNLLADVMPFLIVKQRQAQLLFDYCENHKRRPLAGGLPFSEVLIYCSLRHLNARGYVKSPCKKCPFKDNCEVL